MTTSSAQMYRISLKGDTLTGIHTHVESYTISKETKKKVFYFSVDPVDGLPLNEYQILNEKLDRLEDCTPKRDASSLSMRVFTKDASRIESWKKELHQMANTKISEILMIVQEMQQLLQHVEPKENK